MTSFRGDVDSHLNDYEIRVDSLQIKVLNSGNIFIVFYGRKYETVKK